MEVYKAINAVQSDLAKTGIAKDRKNEMQGYKFRGIDEVYNALSPLLAKHGLVILPRCTAREVVERTSAKGSILFYVTVQAEFDFVASSDGSKHTIVTYGEAMDSGDKATNKAMSAAYKYAAMQAFAIPTEGDNDADAQTHEVVARNGHAVDEGTATMPGRQAALDAAVAVNQKSIAAIKEGIAQNDLSRAAEAWYELDEETMRALWVAPTKYKNAPFTTREREVMKTPEFRTAHTGTAAPATTF